MPGPGNVGERVRTLRLTRRLSQAQLAGHDLSDSYISLIESGKRTPTPAVLRMLAERLNCTPEYLTDGIEPEQRAHLEVRERHAELSRLGGDPAGALVILDEVLSRSDDVEVTARARWTRAQALADLTENEAAISAFEEIREQAERDPGQGCWLPSVIALAQCYHAVGDLGEAISLGERALARLHELGLTIGREHDEVGRVLMLAHLDRSDLDRVRELGRRIFSGGIRMGETAGQTAAALSLPAAYQAASSRALQTGAVADALYFADRAIEAHGDVDALDARARLFIAGARALLRGVLSYGPKPSGQDADVTAAQEALELLRTAAPRLKGADAAECTIETARALVLLGELDQAVGIAVQVLTDSAHGTPRPLAELGGIQAQMILARARLAQSDRAGARTLLRSTASDLDRLPHSRDVAHTSRELGDLFGMTGDMEGATTAYRQALEAVGLQPTSRPQKATANLAGR